MELSNQEVKPFRQEKHQAHCSCPICDRYRHLLKKISNSKSGYPAVAFIAEIYIFSNFGPAGWPVTKLNDKSSGQTALYFVYYHDYYPMIISFKIWMSWCFRIGYLQKLFSMEMKNYFTANIFLDCNLHGYQTDNRLY